MDYKSLDFQIKGVSPLILHNGQLADPLNDFAKAMKAITSKRKKTDDDYQRLYDLEWEGSLYLDDAETKVVIPGDNLEAMLIEGAKKRKLGEQFKSGILCEGDWPLTYDGPKEVAKLKADRQFRDIRGVRVNNSRVMRCRPIFVRWALKFAVNFLPDVVNEEQIAEAIRTAGRIVGLCDHTPKYGRFVVA